MFAGCQGPWSLDSSWIWIVLGLGILTFHFIFHSFSFLFFYSHPFFLSFLFCFSPSVLCSLPPPFSIDPFPCKFGGDTDMLSVVQSSALLSLKVYSLNAKGLNILEKRSSILAEAYRHIAQVIFLQETHFKSGSTPRLSYIRFPEVYHATYPNTKMKGVLIVLAKSFPSPLTDQVLDPEGRFLFLKGTWKNRKIGQCLWQTSIAPTLDRWPS